MDIKRRNREIVRRYDRGDRISDIARDFDISEGYVQRIARKLGCVARPSGRRLGEAQGQTTHVHHLRKETIVNLLKRGVRVATIAGHYKIGRKTVQRIADTID